jgi:nucleoside phosphorylase
MIPSPVSDAFPETVVDPRRSDRPVAVVAAMTEELAGIARRSTGPRRRLEVGGAQTVTLGGRRVVLSVIGEGSHNAARATEALLATVDLSGVVVVGVAGGLTFDLEPGALLVGREVLTDGVPAPPPDSRWLARIPDDRAVHRGTIVSRSSMLCTRESKARARALLRRGGSAAVDLETATVAEVAASRGVSYIAVRAISDTAGESLPIDFNRFRDDSGRIDRFRVARHSMFRPGLVTPLWRLKRRVSLCAENLARLIVPLLEGGTR